VKNIADVGFILKESSTNIFKRG